MSWEVHRDHLLYRDGTRHGTNRTRRTARLRGRLRRACRRERVDTCWLAILVAFACSEIRLHLSALRFLRSLLLTVPAFTFKLADRFLIFLLALASLLGLAFAALTAFALVWPCAAAAALPFLTDVDVHCIDLNCVWVCPRSARPAVVDDLVTQCLVCGQSTDTHINVLFQTLVCHASTYNSVLYGTTDEIVGLLLILGDVTLDSISRARVHQIVVSVVTAASLRI